MTRLLKNIWWIPISYRIEGRLHAMVNHGLPRLPLMAWEAFPLSVMETWMFSPVAHCPLFLCLCPACVCAKLLQCLTFCNPMDYSPSGSSVHGILQARILEWVSLTSSRGSSQPRGWTHVSCVSCIGRQFFTIGATWEFPCLCPRKFLSWYGHSHSCRMPYHPSESV